MLNQVLHQPFGEAAGTAAFTLS